MFQSLLAILICSWSINTFAQFWYEDRPGKEQLGNVGVSSYYPVSCETDPPADKYDWVERTRRIREDNSVQIEAVRYWELFFTVSTEGYLVLQTKINLLRCDSSGVQRYSWTLFQPRSQDRMYVTNLKGLNRMDQFVSYGDDQDPEHAKVYWDVKQILKSSQLKKLNAGQVVKMAFAIYHAVPNGDDSQFRDQDMIRVLFKGYSFYNPHIEIEASLKMNSEGKLEIVENKAKFLN